MLKELKPALLVFLALTLITGVVYPAVVTGLGQLLFESQANGSLIERAGKPVGSALIGQSFTVPKYFWSRPSATSPLPNNGAVSSGSNLGVTHPNLDAAVRARIDALRAADPGNRRPIPVDLVTAREAGWIRTSRRRRPNSRRSAWRAPADFRLRRYARWYRPPRRDAPSACWASRG
jgi:K+-transporting ATPase ATPase C chain